MHEKRTLQLRIQLDTEEIYTVHTYAKEYASLMDLIAGTCQLPRFGLCSGVGRCGTCLVEICAAGALLPDHRLSCETVVDLSLSNAVIHVSQRKAY